jgi:predicted O-linked N-acetylglucosamine transferase (SPINDLY family)
MYDSGKGIPSAYQPDKVWSAIYPACFASDSCWYALCVAIVGNGEKSSGKSPLSRMPPEEVRFPNQGGVCRPNDQTAGGGAERVNVKINVSETLQTASAAHQAGNLPKAEQLYRQILATDRKHFNALQLLGVIHAQRGEFREAVRLIKAALKVKKNDQQALYNLGKALLPLKRPGDALKCFDKVLSIRPDHAEAQNNRGIALQELHRLDDALECFDEVLAIRPDHAEAQNNRGNILLELHRPDEALQSYDKALAIHPDYFEARNNRGNALLELNHFDEALRNFDQALAIHPDYAKAHNNRGNVLRGLKRLEDSLESYNRALAIEPNAAGTLFNRGKLLRDLRLLDEAVQDFECGINIDPNYSHARGTLYYAKRSACDWRNYEEETSQIMAELRAGRGCGEPWHLFSLSASPCEQLRYAQTWQRENHPVSESPLWTGERYDHDRIRVAYVSADFHEHPMAWLMTGLFEQHDRSKFETIAISFGPDNPGPTRDRLVNAFEHFHDVRQESPGEIARLIRDMEVDIAIDRKGYTRDCRTGIFALRPAPIQVNYLAYPGSMGADYIDYIIADRFVIPEHHQQYYSEKVVYLPDSYQANDSKRVIAERTPERSEVDLPEGAFVFSCFNNNYKITPQMFDIWMRLLAEIEGSVIWFLEANAASSRNMRNEAEKRGIAPDRLVFAKYIDHQDHLARLRLADLFLDTLPFNAHTTASDALWAGLPVLTCLGGTFAGRVGGGLLNAVGLAELVTKSLEEYEARALELARAPDQLSEIRARLGRNRTCFPLFDTDRYRRNLEAAFDSMWARHQRGEKPMSFSVPTKTVLRP